MKTSKSIFRNYGNRVTLVLLLLSLLSSHAFAQNISGPGASTSSAALYPGMAAEYTFTNTVTGGTVKFTVTNGTLYYPNTNTPIPANTLLAYSSAKVRVVWDCGNGNHILSALHSVPNQTYNKTMIITPSQNIPQSVGLTYTDMVGGLPKQLAINHCTNTCAPSIVKSLDKTELKLRFSTGDTYDYGTQPFGKKVTVRVSGYSVIDKSNVSNPSSQLFQFDSTLTINQNLPEEVMIMNLKNIPNWGSWFPNLYAIGVKIVPHLVNGVAVMVENVGTQGVNVNPKLNLSASYNETYITNVSGTTPFSTTLLSALPESNSSTKIKFKWKANCSNDIKVPNWEFQLLKLYNSSQSKADAGSELDIISAPIDWNDALNIETESPTDSISLHITEGSGYYIWRVRPIGNGLPGGIANSGNWGAWTNTGTFTQGAINQPANLSTVLQPFGFFYNQFDADKNWVYSRSFGQSDGSGFKIAEGMSYVTNLWMPRQSQSYVQSNKNVVVNQTLQDYSGRSTFNTLPAPISNQSYFQYKNGFVKNATSNTLYGPADFDANSTYNNPTPTHSASAVHSYYSDSNVDKTIPDCEGFPFSTTLYGMDGEGRVKEQGNVGATLRIQPGSSKTQRVLYGTATKQELVPLFGDETGDIATKIINIDENNVASGLMINQEGKTIASFLVSGGAPNQTDLVDAAEAAPTFTTSYKIDKNTSDGDFGLVSQANILIATPNTNVVVNYTITPKTIEATCGNYCMTCDYKIDFMMLNADDPSVSVFPTQSILIPSGSCSSVQPVVWSYTYNIPTSGTWQVKKVMRTNNVDPNTISAQDSTGKTYWQKITDQITDDIQAAIAPHTQALRPFFEAKDLDGMNAYLDAKSSQFGSGITYDPNTKQYTISPISNNCISLKITRKSCDENLCPSDGAYSSMLIDTWSHDASVIESILKYQQKVQGKPDLKIEDLTNDGTATGTILTKYFFPSWMELTGAKLNDMLNSMKADPHYNADKICESWYKAVMSYKTLRLQFEKESEFPDGEFTKGMDEIDYEVNKKDFNILDIMFNDPNILVDVNNPVIMKGTFDLNEFQANAYKKTYLNPAGLDKLRDIYALEFSRKLIEDNNSAARTLAAGNYNNQEWSDFCNTYNHYFLDLQIMPPNNDEPCWLNPGCAASYVANNPAITPNVEDEKLDVKKKCNEKCDVIALGSFLNLVTYMRQSPDYIHAGDDQDINNNPNAIVVTGAQIGCAVDKLKADCYSDCESVVFPSTPSEIALFLQNINNTVYGKIFNSTVEVAMPTNGFCPDGTGWKSTQSISGNEINQLVKFLNEEMEDYKLNNPGFNGNWDIYNLMVAYDPSNPGVQNNNCRRTDGNVLPHIVPLYNNLSAYFTTHGTCDLFYVYEHYVMLNEGLGGSYSLVKDSIRLCNWICTEISCPSICYRYKPLPVGGAIPLETCAEKKMAPIINQYFEDINETIETNVLAYKKKYLTTCINPNAINEFHTAEYNTGFYHFTLYYYDRSGSLVKTVPPMGVNLVDPLSNHYTHPNHTLATEYEHNSLGQVIKIKTPDQGETNMYYNSLGMLRFSQTSKQKAEGSYTYTKYDNLGRLTEGGKSTQLVSGIVSFTNQAALDDNTFPATGRTEVVLTNYDAPSIPVASIQQNFLKNRIAQLVSDRDGDLLTFNDQTSTYYSYDTHGNVELSAQITGQDINVACLTGQCLGVNITSYTYDVVSGKVLESHYNTGKPDAFHHRYTYDADNRLLTVETSVDGIIWDKNISNQYYAHGPLKRQVIGNGVQGLDYVYTLQGWTKAINHPSLNSSNDPAGDGVSNNVCPDIYSEMLGYYSGDFKRLNSPFNSTATNPVYLSGEGASTSGLYNGNISSVISNITTPAIAALQYPNLTGNRYRYDKLGRLTKARFNSFNQNTNQFEYKAGDYDMNLGYDLNGNITSLMRNGTAGASANGQREMDNLTYNYKPGTNQLTSVNDAVPAANYTNDIDNQSSNNYTYWETGELKTDVSAGLNYTWLANGKLKTVTNSITNQKIEFYYDALGNRTMKDVRLMSNNSRISTTYYVYGAGGSLVSVYEWNPATAKIIQKEVPIYGASRIGVYNSGVSK